MVKLAGEPGGASLGQLLSMAADPWSNIFQILVYSAYLFWGYKESRGR
jgi:hypothetical protein